jgi:hypothetical protein
MYEFQRREPLFSLRNPDRATAAGESKKDGNAEKHRLQRDPAEDSICTGRGRGVLISVDILIP